MLKGAVLYGLDPTIVHVRRARKTYGIGIIKPFVRGVHPEGKHCHAKLIFYSLFVPAALELVNVS